METIACWGNNIDGVRDTPAGTFTAVAIESYTACGIRADGAVTCWRHDDAPAGAFTAIAAGSSHLCGLRTDGTIACWGSNDFRATQLSHSHR